jgi:hypothetical protein
VTYRCSIEVESESTNSLHHELIEIKRIGIDVTSEQSLAMTGLLAMGFVSFTRRRVRLVLFALSCVPMIYFASGTTGNIWALFLGGVVLVIALWCLSFETVSVKVVSKSHTVRSYRDDQGCRTTEWIMSAETDRGHAVIGDKGGCLRLKDGEIFRIFGIIRPEGLYIKRVLGLEHFAALSDADKKRRLDAQATSETLLPHFNDEMIGDVEEPSTDI